MKHPFTRWLIVCTALLVAGGGAWLWIAPRPPLPLLYQLVWTFEPPPRGAIAAGVCVKDTSIYVATIRDGLRPEGAVYSLDRFSGAIRWHFDARRSMLHTISTPTFAGDRLLFGEGMHGDLPCHLYCLDPTNGALRWRTPLGGHIESGPVVGAEHVYCTAGDDGLHALALDDGKSRWNYRGSGHIDAAPCLDGDRLYGGSGVSRLHQQTEAFCLHAATGRPIWRVPTLLPVWGSPIVDRDDLFIPMGNGRLLRSEEPPGTPAGGLLCLEAKTGREKWTCKVGDSVFAAPVLSGEKLYFVCRDGFCYALHRDSGTLIWKRSLGSPVVARPALSDDRLYIATIGGVLVALERHSGRTLWQLDLAMRFPSRPQLLSAPVTATGPQGQHWIYLGTELRSSAGSAALLCCVEDRAELTVDGS